jgi:hypothetical protein
VPIASSWLTAARLQRLVQALRQIPGQAPGLSVGTAERIVWSNCGGPFDEVAQHIAILRDLSLLIEAEETVLRTRLGNQVVKAFARGDLTLLGLLMIRAGWFHDQGRVLIEAGIVGLNGSLSCPRRVAAAGAPQLTGVLAWWSEVQIRPAVVIPSQLLAELNTVWALLPPAGEVAKFLSDRKAVGDRAEMYTVQFERSRASDASGIAWVARDSDSLGWDVEDRTLSPSRCIEVKGRRDSMQQFYLSENELRKAKELGSAYELHFWGNIDLNREPAVEYAVLRASGYPLVLPHFHSVLGSGAWQIEPVRWRISLKIAAVPKGGDEV